ncbi:sigma-54 dependent transcriptional regulator [Oligoflexia bacterium]|nr:sigma-54 dependent transcriptional regulator [Oligoflexia bacterium]
MVAQAVAPQGSLSVLVVDDDNTLRRSIVLNLQVANYAVRDVSTAQEGLDILNTEHFDIVLCDLRMPQMDGMTFIDQCRQVDSEAAIILMTGFGNSDLAIEAMRRGAYDYISKPFATEELLLTLRKIEERERLKEENKELKSAIEQKYSFSNIVAQSKPMKELFETVKRLANFNTTVLIRGESGTGKELLALAIHHNSPRRGKPFIAINCGAIPENLMETELFGHKKGAFTDASRDKKGLFEEASGGTLFLDEIGEMSLHLQVKLLRALQEQQIRRVGDEAVIDIDVRVIAATLRDLENDVESGRFREDLYYRLNVVSLPLLPLRERPEDIPVLMEHFLKKHSKRLGLPSKKIDPEALKCLMQYRWRGNVRELENCIERALVLSEAELIDIDALPDHVRKSFRSEGEDDALPEDNLSIKQHAKALEVKLIKRALEETKGNRTHAAKILEISHRALLYKLKEYGLTEQGKK